ncbi:MAG: HAD family hydrolase [Pseudomonadota bacterium]
MIAKPKRIAVWSGPRNLSTAMMRSFGARSDTLCIDEPFYASFLKLTGLDHPMRDEILAAHSADADAVARQLSEGPAMARVIYQKQMTHHMVDGIPRDWMEQVTSVFLIRHPARVLTSYARKMEKADIYSIGFPQQAELYHEARARTNSTPIIVDADDILNTPETILSALCSELEIDFESSMLGWEAGGRPEDGVWASHWYDAVLKSTGFGPAPSDLPDLPPNLQLVCDRALPNYEMLAKHKLGLI